jgi:hypothetical protein
VGVRVVGGGEYGTLVGVNEGTRDGIKVG